MTHEHRTHPEFDNAVQALDGGDVEALRSLLDQHPELIHARTNLAPPFHYFSGATLLHHVAGNPDRGRLDGRTRPLSAATVAMARMLLDAGADVHAETLGANGGTTMGLVLTSKQASDADVAGALIDLLLEYGDRLDVHARGVLSGSLANHAPRAAEKLIALGAKPGVLGAAALGRLEWLRDCFDGQGRLKELPRPQGVEPNERDAIGLALLVAYVNGQHEAVDFLIEKDGNWNVIGVNNGAALHRAAWDGDIAMMSRLIERGVDPHNRDNPFHSTPLSWAQHNRQQAAFHWLREHTNVDLHDAVCFDLPEHIEARLAEDPASVNRQIDQWEIPMAAPLHWACWTQIEDVAGTRDLDPD
ncbi:MAG: ankyrin repeat domain-containing protein [Longimicrobiales bacterium]